MVFVQRDGHNRIIRVDGEPFSAMTQPMQEDDPEVIAFRASNSLSDRLLDLQRSDLEMVRVVEDLVTVLVSKGVIRYTDLPEAAQRKLSMREETRAKLNDLTGLLGSDEEHFP
ncbi:Tryptophan synthase beta chain like [Pseudomonas marincola]|jgi:hypothetical protein|uniref:Tryptophan synthase subunit beta n=1 Tax=Pseudomonas marincola TaxID=437900 RepID=A0A653E6U2_9PSED|nr:MULTISPECIES: tryptophan synthase subunit beta [Pseudomonas]NRH26758.1 tryptophan synthase subunit beta [Pseudomonas sp. MS19]CAE6909995.1 Tryptophan synthase beta chain like [Pseudomonas marincola]